MLIQCPRPIGAFHPISKHPNVKGSAMTNGFKANNWRSVAATAALALVIIVTGCAQPKGKSVADKRAYIQNMSVTTMAKMGKINPGVKRELVNYPGWGVFETVQTGTGITTTNNGFGLVHSNTTGKEYYMKGFGVGAGITLGIKASKIVAIFETDEALNKFVTEGWTIGVSGSATGKAVKIDKEAVGEHKFNNGIKIYIYTENGLMAGVAMKGGKVWLDKELN